jgi:methyl-accepting chemotaxis protein
MDWIKHSIRNKLLVITGVSTGLVVGAAGVGFWLSATNAAGTGHAVRTGLAGLLPSLGLMAVAICIAFVWFLIEVNRHIVVPARRLASDLQRMAGGDFTIPIVASSQDEIGRIAQSAERTRVDLGAMVTETQRSIQEVSQATQVLQEVTQEVMQSSQRQNELAATAAKSIQGVTSSLGAVSENAVSVHDLSHSSVESVEKGNEKVSELIGEIDQVEGTINAIAESVHKFMEHTALISNMTQQVKDIANQTNLLALNAAIEAARAGEQGRGFSVVADEVRKLAEKSAQAAGEIDSVTKNLGEQSGNVEAAIEHGQAAMRTSLDFLETVAMVLAEANSANQQANRGINDISAATREQSDAVVGVAENVAQILQCVTTNFEAIQRTAQSTGVLNDLATRLQTPLSRMKG